jgi:phosphatidylglycerol---prolipoprotein diacylglyceryl transferase
VHLTLALIPYLTLPQLNLGLGQKIDIFGVLSAAGVLAGAYLAAEAARWYGPGDDGPLRDVAFWAVASGFVGGHLLHVLAYHPETLRWSDPTYILRMWEGLSSMGGVLGALLGIVLYFRFTRVSLLPHLDALALGTAPGWAIARVGCFLVHDHPGVPSDFFLAVDFPGGPRHDLGLYDALVLGAISAVLYALARRKPKLRQGRLMGVLAVGYTVPRFFLDFLRASDFGLVDARYFGLTPAQYIVLGLFAVGVWLLTRRAEPVAEWVKPAPAA